MGHPAFVAGVAKTLVGLPPDFLSSLLALANLMRLFLLKAAHAVLDDCHVAGNPGRPSFSAHVRYGERGAPVPFLLGFCCETGYSRG
jgi:hypothetical protein